MADILIRRDVGAKIETYSLRSLVQNIAPCVKEHVFFLLAWSGCDTTSHCYGIGKQAILNGLKKLSFQENAKRVSNPTASQIDVMKAEMKLFCHLHGQANTENLTLLRRDKFQQMLSPKK